MIPEPGKWYWGVCCKLCGRPVAIMEDVTPPSPVTFKSDGQLNVLCPYLKCHYSGAYCGNEVQHFQGQNTDTSSNRAAHARNDRPANQKSSSSSSDSAIRKPALRLMIGNKELRAIGHVVAQWALLEERIDDFLAVLLTGKPAADQGASAPLSCRMRLLRDGVKEIFGVDSSQGGGIMGVFDKISGLKGERDKVVHGQWGLYRTPGGMLTTGITRIKRDPMLKVDPQRLTAEQTEEIACRISEAHLQLIWHQQFLSALAKQQRNCS